MELSHFLPKMSSDHAKLLAATPATRSKLAWGLGLAVASQLGWGLYPVCARALLTQEPKLTLLELTVGLNAFSALQLAVGSAVLRALRRRANPHVKRPASRMRRLAALILGFATCIAARAFTNLASAGYAPAHWCVMINLCTPVVCAGAGLSRTAERGPHESRRAKRVDDGALVRCMWSQFTAAIGRFCLHQPLPPGTLVALVSGLGGSALAIFGGSKSTHHSTVAPALLALGIGLAFASSIALAVYQHIVKLTKGVLSEGFVLTLNYAVMLVPAGTILGIQTGLGTADAIASFAALNGRQWIILCVFSSVVYLGANLAQQLAIRQLGPTLVAALMPLRLLSSVTGSLILLQEGITSSAEAGGLVVVAVTTAVYLGRQLVHSSSQQGSSQVGTSTSTTDPGRENVVELPKEVLSTKSPGTDVTAQEGVGTEDATERVLHNG